MEIPLNNSPVLSMAEITKKLFNSKLLSDIQFDIGGELIYAHSLELMKRSVLFQQQLETNLGETKLIPVRSTNFKCFYQFIRFIYTDECEINVDAIGLLKLATTYKVVKLENLILLNLFNGTESEHLSLFEYCVVNKYKLPYSRIKKMVVANLSKCLKSERSLSLKEDAIETILKFDYVPEVVGSNMEVEIFEQLVRWINHHSEENGVTVAQKQSRFDNLIRLIRFPAMGGTELFKCVSKNRALFKVEDFGTLFEICAFPECTSQKWLSDPRKIYKPNIEIAKQYDHVLKEFQTIFSISEDATLSGLEYGILCDPYSIKYEIEISSGLNNVLVLDFTRNNNSTAVDHFIILGESIKLKRDILYTIKFKFFGNNNGYQYNITTRKSGYNVLINGGPSNLVSFTEVSPYIIGMDFN